MQIRLSCDGDSLTRDARALADWLRRVDELSGRADATRQYGRDL